MYDVVIIGGGMVGTYCAYECASQGLQTVLLERHELASGASGRGGGLLLKGATDVFAPEIVPHLVANQQLLEAFLEQTGADVDYVRGGSLYVSFENDWNFTQTQVQRMCAAGLKAEVWDEQQLRSEFPVFTPKAVGGRFIASDAQLASPKLTLALAQAARQAGADIRTDTQVLSLIRSDCGEAQTVQTPGQTFTGKYLILATNAYTGDLCPELKSVIVPTRGQVLLTGALPESFPFGCAANYDKEYWRQTRSGQILFCGCRRLEKEVAFGKDTESTETTAEVQQGLQETFKSFFPEWGSQLTVEKTWAGTMGFTPDLKPVIGRVPDHKNVLIGAGFSGNGLPFVCLTGHLLCDLIVRGETSLPLTPFDPGRFDT
jgi:glycine/D-amino acid oxidase-like deaminating enzyme